jgi:putative endonuclease
MRWTPDQQRTTRALRSIRGTRGDGRAVLVYILASKRNGTLYVGVTNNLVRRLSEHKAKLVPGFTRKYELDQLVYFEAFDSILEARAREHSLKRWRRAWKIALIEKLNPDWRDLKNELKFLRHLPDACSCPGCCAARRSSGVVRC